MFIAIKLLASCYTLLPATSADDGPILQQRKQSKLITALRLQTLNQYPLAAGHHARTSSESAPWSGLYAGPSCEDRLLQQVQMQRFKAFSNESIPQTTARIWTDGPPPIRLDNSHSGVPSSSTSSSDNEYGLLSRFICQAGIPKHPRRRHNTLFSRRSSTRKKHKAQYAEPDLTHVIKRRPRKKSRHQVTSQAVQRIPSALRLRHTQSAPRIAVDEEGVADHHTSHRPSSNPSIGSALTYDFEIPRVHRTPATPARGRHDYSPPNSSIRACGRGDLICMQDYFDDAVLLSSNGKSHNQSTTLLAPPQPVDLRSNHSPLPPSTGASFSRASTIDHLGNIYNMKSGFPNSGDADDEQEALQLSGVESPDLRRILDDILTDDENSSGSEMEETRKRKNILNAAEGTEEAIVGKFAPHGEEASGCGG